MERWEVELVQPVSPCSQQLVAVTGLVSLWLCSKHGAVLSKKRGEHSETNGGSHLFVLVPGQFLYPKMNEIRSDVCAGHLFYFGKCVFYR